MKTSHTILVLGSTGMLGQALMSTGSALGLSLFGAARFGAELSVDIQDSVALNELVSDIKPSVIINAAAITDIATCEKNPDRAYLTNARCVATLAEYSHFSGSWLVQVSTDHYFSGDGSQPHQEYSSVRLLNEYARTKYAAEGFALTCPNALVVRTNIVGFRGYGTPTFLEWILEEFVQGRTIRAFEDYFVSSMTTGQFATALFSLLPKGPIGILNLAAREIYSKRRFIETVRDTMLGGVGRVEGTSVRTLPGAPRAESLGLDVSRAEALLGYPLPTLADVVGDLAATYKERKTCVTTA